VGARWKQYDGLHISLISRKMGRFGHQSLSNCPLAIGRPRNLLAKWAGKNGCGKGAAWKSKNNFSTPLGNPAAGVRFPLSHSPGGDGIVTAEQVDGPDVVL